MYYLYWYGYQNWSRYWHHNTRITHITHKRYVCNGVEHWETEYSYDYGECFEWFEAQCNLDFDNIPVDAKVNDRECP